MKFDKQVLKDVLGLIVLFAMGVAMIALGLLI